MLMCFHCWQIFDPHIVKHEYALCPIRGCEGPLIDIDENLLVAIRLLNEKGYATKFCCSGHVYGNTLSERAFAYISFHDDIERNELRSLPKGWSLDENPQNGEVIRAELKHNDPVKLQNLIFKAIEDVSKWADGLPPRAWE